MQGQLSIEGLIGFRSADSHWQIGKVVWMRADEQGDMQVGVYILSTEAIPLGIDVPLHLGANVNNVPAIFLPYEKRLDLPATMIVTDTLLQDERDGERCATGFGKRYETNAVISSNSKLCTIRLRFLCGDALLI